MIRCTPQSICSWDFYLQGEGHDATLQFKWLGEQGSIAANGVNHEVRKHGLFSGHWTLELAGEPVASAQKPTILARVFDMQDDHGRLTLRAVSPFSRCFHLECSGDPIATIAPIHPFTRRATIHFHTNPCAFTTVAFAFWLVVLTWRRAAQNS